MQERTNSLLSNSVQIENRVRQLSDKLDDRLRQSVGVDSQKHERLSTNCESIEKSIDSSSTSFSQLEARIQSLNNSSALLSQKDAIIKQLNTLLANKEQQRADLQKENILYKQTIEEKRKSINKLQQRSIRYKITRQKLQLAKVALQQLKRSQTNLKSQATSKFISLKRDISHSVQTIEQATTRQAKVEINAASFITEKDNEILKQKQKYKRLLNLFYDTCYALSSATGNLPPEKSHLSQASEDFITKVTNSIYASRFLAESKIARQQQGKLWLMDKLKHFTKYDQKITSRLLYEYDPRNKANLHHYIDDKPNILVIAQLQNGYIIGGFTIHPFSKTSKANKQKQSDGFLFNLLQRQSYDSKSFASAPIFIVTNYDEYFLIFGNSELRIKSGDLELFSNFGISNGTFESGTTTLTQFMGTSDKEKQFKLKHYEVHQLWP